MHLHVDLCVLDLNRIHLPEPDTHSRVTLLALGHLPVPALIHILVGHIYNRYIIDPITWYVKIHSISRQGVNFIPF